MTNHAETVAVQRRKGRDFITRAVNVHIYMQDNQPAILVGGESGRHVTLVDATTGQEVTMDADMFDFIAKTVQGRN